MTGASVVLLENRMMNNRSLHGISFWVKRAQDTNGAAPAAPLVF